MEKVEHQVKGEAPAEKAPASVVAADMVITGNVEAALALEVAGRVKGDVTCTILLVAEDAVIDGNIHAERVRILGTVNGSIDTKDLAIEAKGRVCGDIGYERLKIASGAFVDGSLRCKAAEAKRDTGKLKLVDTPAPPAQSDDSREPDHVFIE
jgi:cytoskeletal protein CcmA (bactofilin family)